LDTGSKREIYARTGTTELWVVDPDAKRIQVYALRRDADVPAATHGPGEEFTSRLFPGLKIRSDEIFQQ